MEDQLVRLKQGAVRISQDGADVTQSYIEATERTIGGLRRLHGGCGSLPKETQERPPTKHDKEAEPDRKALLKELLVARKNVLQQIEWVNDPPPSTSGLTGSEMRHFQIEMQLRDLNHTLKELEECIDGLRDEEPEPTARE
jgi:hypothetical protein